MPPELGHVSRKQELLDFTQTELNQVKEGETNKISAPAELAKQFGYRPETSKLLPPPIKK